MGFLQPVVRMLSPGGSRGKLLVLIFHRVLVESDPLLPGEPDAIQFDWMMRFVSRNFHVLPFGQAVSRLNSGKLAAASACITFDDGYKDNFSVAMPILQRHGLIATFFVASGFLDGGRMWNDDVIEAVRVSSDAVADWSEFGLGRYHLTTHYERLSAINAVLAKLKYLPLSQREATAREIARRARIKDKSDLMMGADDLRAIRAAGMEIGGHTQSHPILSSLGDSEAYAQILRGKNDLEAILSERVDVFAYPNGKPGLDLSSRHVQMLRRAGFVAAVTTQRGVGGIETDPFMMPRFTPWDRTPARFAARCMLALAGRC